MGPDCAACAFMPELAVSGGRKAYPVNARHSAGIPFGGPPYPDQGPFWAATSPPKAFIRSAAIRAASVSGSSRMISR
jgi:hypothetical protein